LHPQEDKLIYGSYDKHYPVYYQGPRQTATEELCTAAEVNNLVQKIISLEAEVQMLQGMLKTESRAG
jgi:hypothetical protein